MKRAALVYPHQLYRDHPALRDVSDVILLEDPLFFKQYHFHRQKLMLHRASMKRFAAELIQAKKSVHYLDSSQLPTTEHVTEHLAKLGIGEAVLVDPCDDWLGRKLSLAMQKANRKLTMLEDPHFLTSRLIIQEYTRSKKKLFFTDFYIQQRKRLKILCEDDSPIGGKWSFDPENRKKLPPQVRVPRVRFPTEDEFVREARQYVQRQFPDALGEDTPFRYPTCPDQSRAWLSDFLKQRFKQFGDYEDAMHVEHDILFHSVLTPMLNTGLLTPRQIVEAVIEFADEVPLNSLEGFLRQIIGWREFIRLVYLTHGRKQRVRNFWEYQHPLPAAFYDGSTGIEPVDHVIKQVLRTGYCHHIERLMILGNFMLLCEIHPDAVYQWFMELFIDSYDWVMVSNVYGMSQHADGGLMTTKPYISGSSYVLKMSNFKKGKWCEVWDALYWRFIDKHTNFFAKNPRMAMMAKMKDKLGDKLDTHRRIADAFLKKLHNRPG